jgi:UDP-2,3-diacylglucosamine pyrophosphatase LpxH
MRNSRWDRWRRSALDALKALPHGDRKARMIRSGLAAAYDRAGDPVPFAVRREKLVIFSDHHRGTGKDDADDFRRCERAYRAALGHYFEHGFTLVLLGDVEELWENRLARVLESYSDVLALERRFHDEQRLWRFYGNHDLNWSSPQAVNEHLGPHVGDRPIEVRESLKVDIIDDNEILGRLFLVHGHQGTPSSDLFAPVAMLPVRYLWPRLQRSVKFASTTPARDYELREEHDSTMYEWARRQASDRHPADPPLVMVAGHTHKPVFFRREAEEPAQRTDRTLPTPEQARADYEAAVAAGAPAEQRAAAHAMLQFVSTKDFGPPPLDITPPCYFNSGCCSYGDGDVTGIEIADGSIRLVRWLDNDGNPKLQALSPSESLREVFDQVRAARQG